MEGELGMKNPPYVKALLGYYYSLLHGFGRDY
jgi:hypothetical protein